ncbi:MAG: RDD family protein [Ruminococcus sp.]|nr:RDD family protein [Ruminococcus sp.]
MSIKLKRLLAGLIDFYIICFISSFLVYFITLGKMNVSFLSLSTYLLSVYALVIYKDNFFGNASIGKKILKIKIISTNQTGLNLITNFKRSLLLVLLPIELLLIIIDNKRLGDMWAKTTVIES